MLSTSNILRVVDIVDGTSVDGPGLRTSVYFAGCAHKCPGCHNEHTWDFAAGDEMTVEELINYVRREGFNVTFSGGDPIYQAPALIELARLIKAESLTIWCYTGFTFEDLIAGVMPEARKLLDYVDVLVDGPFVKELKDTSLRFRGSSNQRLIDVPASLASGSVKELNYD